MSEKEQPTRYRMLDQTISRITPLVEKHLTESQFGCRKGRGTREAINVL